MLILNSIVFLMFLLAFIAIAETIYWTSRKEYLEAKAKYLRELIGTKNDLDSPSKPFSSCVYEKWESGEMDLLEAASVCELKY